MGKLALDAVDTSSKARGSARFLLVTMARLCDARCECYAAVGTLAGMMGTSTRTVQRGLRELKELGEIRLLEEGGGSYRHTSRYLLTPGRFAPSRRSRQAPEQVTPVTPVPPGGNGSETGETRSEPVTTVSPVRGDKSGRTGDKSGRRGDNGVTQIERIKRPELRYPDIRAREDVASSERQGFRVGAPPTIARSNGFFGEPVAPGSTSSGDDGGSDVGGPRTRAPGVSASGPDVAADDVRGSGPEPVPPLGWTQENPIPAGTASRPPFPCALCGRRVLRWPGVICVGNGCGWEAAAR